MDANKLQKLRDIDYKFVKCCSNCEKGDFYPKQDFGICLFHKYEHLKHSDNIRSLSIHRYGVCNNHIWEKGFLYRMGAELWDEFI